MNKMLHYTLPLLLLGSTIFCSDSASVEQLPQQGSSLEQAANPTLDIQRPEEQKTWTETIKDFFKPQSVTYTTASEEERYQRPTRSEHETLGEKASDAGHTIKEKAKDVGHKIKDFFTGRSHPDYRADMSQGASLGERASAAGQRAEVKTKDFFSDRNRPDYRADLSEGPTVGERASATAQTAKVKAKDWLSSIRETFSGDNDPEGRTRSYRRARIDSPSSERSFWGPSRTSEAYTGPASAQASYDERGTSSANSPFWENLKREVRETFGTKQPRAQATAA